MYPIKGDPLILGCNTSDNWRVCIFKKEGHGEVCKFQYTFTKDRIGSPWENDKLVCDSIFNNPVFEGSVGHETGKLNQLCQIKIDRAEYEHTGEYECKFFRCGDINNGKCQITTKGHPSTAKIAVKVLNCYTNILISYRIL